MGGFTSKNIKSIKIGFALTVESTFPQILFQMYGAKK